MSYVRKQSREKTDTIHRMKLENRLPAIPSALGRHLLPALADLMFSMVHHLQILTSSLPR
jgi:hypothetical protein